MIFGTRHERKQKNIRKERDFKLEGGGGLEGFQTVVCLRGHVGKIYSTRDIQTFHVTITLQCEEPEPTCLWFCYHAHQRVRSVCFTCKANDKIIF